MSKPPDLSGLKRRLQRRQGEGGPFGEIDAKTEEQRARPEALRGRQRCEGMSELDGLLQDAREGLELRRELVDLEREALGLERERAELTSPWWVRMLRRWGFGS